MLVHEYPLYCKPQPNVFFAWLEHKNNPIVLFAFILIQCAPIFTQNAPLLWTFKSIKNNFKNCLKVFIVTWYSLGLIGNVYFFIFMYVYVCRSMYVGAYMYVNVCMSMYVYVCMYVCMTRVGKMEPQMSQKMQRQK